jgi:hypothetical protein
MCTAACRWIPASYEWTSLVRGNNLHRVVIYKDDGNRAIQQLPYTNADSSDPEDAKARNPATVGYRTGVPMGGDLYGAKKGEEVPMSSQEHAYTSPIWYTP